MPMDSSIKTVFVEVHLGSVPSYSVKAASDENATDSQCPNTGTGTGPNDGGFLREVLDKLSKAYGTKPSVNLCIRNSKIYPDAQCP
jgi:hypothetical protein